MREPIPSREPDTAPLRHSSRFRRFTIVRALERIDLALLVGLRDEMRLFPTREQADAAVREFGRTGKRRWVRVLLILMVVSVAGMSYAIDAWVTQSTLVRCALLLVCGYIVLLVFQMLRFRWFGRPYMREKLLECRVPVCMKCGYCLRGLVSDCCPECGKELDERVRALIREEAQSDGRGASNGSAPSASRAG